MEESTSPNSSETTDASEPLARQILPTEPITDPRSLRLFFDPPGTLRLTVADQYSYPVVKLYQAAPLSRPGRHLSLQSGKSEEIVLIDRIEDLSEETRLVAEEEIRRRYLTARVNAITGIRTEFGITYWNVETDKGHRDFVVQSLSESCVWLSDTHILLIDTDGNRFEIANSAALDAPSQERLASVL